MQVVAMGRNLSDLWTGLPAGEEQGMGEHLLRKAAAYCLSVNGKGRVVAGTGQLHSICGCRKGRE